MTARAIRWLGGSLRTAQRRRQRARTQEPGPERRSWGRRSVFRASPAAGVVAGDKAQIRDIAGGVLHDVGCDVHGFAGGRQR